MKLSEYFENTAGLGVLATADAQGKVDVAIYARPHFIDEQTCAFIMADRLTHKNLQSNPHAAYLFAESDKRYVGKRLFLTKTKEEKDSPLIDKLRRKKYPAGCEEEVKEARFLVYFNVNKVLPLIGTK